MVIRSLVSAVVWCALGCGGGGGAAPRSDPPPDDDAGSPIRVAGPEAGVADRARVEPDAERDRGPSPEAGAGAEVAAADVRSVDVRSPDAPGDVGRNPVFVAVGYAGRRIRSRDLGMTWEDDQTLGGGGDDEFLLRGVSWGRGVFVAVGWKILTSHDGARWTEQRNPERQWLGGIQYGNDRFVAAGGYGYSAFSTDGLVWTRGRARATEAARSLAFGGGMFIAATDPGNWWSTANGDSWTNIGGGHTSRVVHCADGFKDARDCPDPRGRNDGRTAFSSGVHVGIRNGTIERSTDGSTWRAVRTGGAAFEAVTVGFVP